MNKVILIGIILLVVGCKPNIYDRFCIKLGHNKSDGFRDIGEFGDPQHIIVKCDGEVKTNYRCHNIWDCCSRNEYGECLMKAKGLWCWDRANEATWISGRC